jgi:hypothetical protein
MNSRFNAVQGVYKKNCWFIGRFVALSRRPICRVSYSGYGDSNECELQSSATTGRSPFVYRAVPLLPALPPLLPPMPLLLSPIPLPLDPLLPALPLLLPPRPLPLEVPLRPLLPVLPLPVPVLPIGGQSILDCAKEPLPALPLRSELLVLPVLPPELLLLELELPLPVEPLPEATLPSGQSALERALLLPLFPDVLPELPVDPEVPELELPVPNPCEPLPLEEPPLVCDQPGCNPKASVLERANAVMIILRLLIRSCLLLIVMKFPTVALELLGDAQGLCHLATHIFPADFFYAVAQSKFNAGVPCTHVREERVTIHDSKIVVYA